MPESPTSSEPVGPPGRAAASANRLGRDLVAVEAGLGPGNVLLSPGSLAFCLGMALNAAAGRTRDELAGALHVRDLSEEELNRGFGELLRATQATGPFELEVANALWGPPGTSFDVDFTHRLGQFYGAEARILPAPGRPAADAVNAWVSEQTKGRITDLVSAEDLAGPVGLVLANALHLKGRWAVRFDVADTRPGTFTRPDDSRVDVQMMHRTGPYPYLETDDLQAVGLDHLGGGLRMYVVLPAPDTTVTSVTWEPLIADSRVVEVSLTLPRFSVTCQTELVRSMGALGVTQAFGAGANFSRSGVPGVFVSVGRHRARIDVAEEGTEGSASTVAISERSLPFAGVMVVDRPFDLAVVDRRTGLFQLLGRVSDPRPTPAGPSRA